ncbi:MAG: hypothetical protein QM737_02660 [Ferruginibacter sp.]
MKIEGIEYNHDFLIRKEEFFDTLIFIDNSFENDKLKPSVWDYISDKSIDSFEINSTFLEKKVNGIFLYQIPNIKRLRILTIDFLQIDFNQKSFLGLTHLCNNVNTEEIDFNNLKKLEEIDLKWSNNRNGLFNCLSLRRITLHGYKGQNLKEFLLLKNIENLELISSSIGSIDGIENLNCLQKIELHFCPKLTSLFALSLLKKLEVVIISNLNSLNSLNFFNQLESLNCAVVRDCKKINSSDELLHLKNLTYLGVHNAGALTSLKPIVNLKKIKRVTLGQTKILDGDVSPLLKLKSLAYIQFADSRELNYKLVEIKTILNLT